MSTSIVDLFVEKPDLEVHTLEDLDSSGVHHISVVDLRTGIAGDGSDFDGETAQAKALSELVERTVFRKVGDDLSSSGYACFPEPDEACDRATAELVERDALLTSWILDQPPRWESRFSEEQLRSKGELSSLFNWFEVQDVDIRIGTLAVTGDLTSVCVVSRPKDLRRFGCVLTSACSRDQVDAIRSALLNQHRALSHAFSAPQNGTSEKGPGGHLKHYFAKDNMAPMDQFSRDGSVRLLSLPKFQVNVWEVPLWNGQRTYVARARSSDLQAYFCGPSGLYNLNRNRLRQLSRRPYRLNRAIHPLA